MRPSAGVLQFLVRTLPKGVFTLLYFSSNSRVSSAMKVLISLNWR